MARMCANSYWSKLSNDIHCSCDSGNVRYMYEGIKKATGPSIKKSAPLKAKDGSIITDPNKQMEIWVEHYYTEPTLDEVSKAIDAISCGKAPGIDGIPPELMKHAKEGIYIRTRDGKLYSTAHLHAKTKVLSALIRDLLFADDAAIVAHSEADLQKLMDKLSHACKAFGLTIRIEKTKILAQGVTDPNTSMKIDGNELENVNKFNYLGSTISSSLFLTDEINARTVKAAAAYSKLEERVWKNRNLTINTKIWLEHVKRMEIDRIPKQLLYVELQNDLVPPDGHSYASRMCANVILKPQQVFTYILDTGQEDEYITYENRANYSSTTSICWISATDSLIHDLPWTKRVRESKKAKFKRKQASAKRPSRFTDFVRTVNLERKNSVESSVDGDIQETNSFWETRTDSKALPLNLHRQSIYADGFTGICICDGYFGCP
eukprot:gene308-9962_t